jgi:hypothetical protein
MAVDPKAQKSIDEQNVYIRDTLMSIAAKYGEVLKDAVEDAFDSAEASVLNSVGKDLTRSFTKLAKASDEFAFNQSRIKKGLLNQKDIEKQINSIQEKREGLERKIEHARRLGLQVSKEDYALSLESLQVQQEQLENDLKLTKSVSNKIALQKAGDELAKKYRLDQFNKTTLLVGLFKSLIDAGLRVNKVSVDIGKNLGYGADNATRYTQKLVKAAQSSDNLNFTLQNAADAANEISSETGYVAEYSADALETQIMLTKQFGLTGKEAAGIYELSVLTGKSSKTVNDNMVKAFVATRNQLGKAVPFKAAMAEAATVSGRLAANLQNNPETIVKAVVATRALGTSLEQTAKQGEALLNFESSIENELKAELLTGKSLNLERARAAALAGDQVTLAQELANQIGSLTDFQKMNVIQQKAVAEAVGLTADELANQLRKQEIAKKNGESLAQLTEREAKEAEQRQNIQDKFNAAMLKLQDLIGNLVSGPLGYFIDGLSKGLDIIGKIFGKIGKVGEALKSIPGFSQIGKLVGGLASVATIGALIAIVGRSLLKGTDLVPMVVRMSGMGGIGGGNGGGGGGGFDISSLFGGGKGKGKTAWGGKPGKIPKGFKFPKGVSTGAKGLSKLTKASKVSGALSLLGVGLDLASNLTDENRSTGNALGKTLDQNKFMAAGAGIGALFGGVGAIPGAAIGGILDLVLGDSTKIVDDMVGYGARTLVTPTGNVALNNNDTVIAGTNLFKGDDVLSMPKGSLTMDQSAGFASVVEAIKKLTESNNTSANRPIKLYVDGTEMITKVEKGTTKTA